MKLADARKLSEKIKKKGGGDLKAIRQNIVDAVWGNKKPARPNENVKVHDENFAGKSFSEKVDEVRKELEKRKSAGFVVCKCPPIMTTPASLEALTEASYARRDRLAFQPTWK